jgi:Fur family ferric uptake transcriptional regulator
VDLLCAKAAWSSTPEFVIDTLKLLCRYGFAQQHTFDNGVYRYEHRHLGQHHDHMVCTKCKKILEFQNDQIENLQVSVAATHGFHMLQHKMEIYGICSDCLKQAARMLRRSCRPGRASGWSLKGLPGGLGRACA